jgi:hypothetical protein
MKDMDEKSRPIKHQEERKMIAERRCLVMNGCLRSYGGQSNDAAASAHGLIVQWWDWSQRNEKRLYDELYGRMDGEDVDWTVTVLVVVRSSSRLQAGQEIIVRSRPARSELLTNKENLCWSNYPLTHRLYFLRLATQADTGRVPTSVDE